MILRKGLWKLGYRYKLQSKLPGKPDIVLPKYKAVLFVDGCFWHDCPICNRSMPSTRRDYWRTKIEKNVMRATKNDKELRELGWKVIHIWEHQIRRDLNGTVEELIKMYLR